MPLAHVIYKNTQMREAFLEEHKKDPTLTWNSWSSMSPAPKESAHAHNEAAFHKTQLQAGKYVCIYIHTLSLFLFLSLSLSLTHSLTHSLSLSLSLSLSQRVIAAARTHTRTNTDTLLCRNSTFTLTPVRLCTLCSWVLSRGDRSMCVCVRLCVYVRACVCACVLHTRKHARARTHTHTNTHTYTNTHV